MENKRFLNELTSDEALQVLNNNNDLNTIVYESFAEQEMYFIGEILDCFKTSLKDWTIGFNNHNYLKIKDEIQFIKDYENYVSMYHESDENIEKNNVALKVLNYYENNEDEDFDYSLIEEQALILKNALLEYFNKITDTKQEHIEEHFLMMIENESFDDYYIIDNELSKVYLDVSYTKTLK
jgi:hypothetical protein